MHQSSTAPERPVGSGRVGGADAGGPFARLPGAVVQAGPGLFGRLVWSFI